MSTTGRRESFAVMDESTAGVPHVRGERSSRNGFTVLDGSATEPAPVHARETAPQGRPRAQLLAMAAEDIIESFDSGTGRRVLAAPTSRTACTRDYHDR